MSELQLNRLEHVNVRTANLDRMVDWYETILGLAAGPRPDFGFPGAWLYLGEHPIVHLVGRAAAPANAEPAIEHFAISATGLRPFLERLGAHGIDHSVDPVPGYPLVQVNLHDCDGNHIHVDFESGEAE